MEKVISELDTSLSEDIKNMYSSKISEIGENYINRVDPELKRWRFGFRILFFQPNYGGTQNHRLS